MVSATLPRGRLNVFWEENKDYILSFITVLIVCMVGAWFVHDRTRNEAIYNNTDSGVERLEKRLDDVGKRLDSLQERVAENQKTVERIGETVTAGRENAVAVENGLGEAERRLDNALQASGRIKNRIAEFERTNK